MKLLLKKRFSDFLYFYSYLGYKIFISIGLSIFVGILDGFGLAMFLPLLQVVGDKNGTGVDPERMGKLKFLITSLSDLGLSINLTSILLVMLGFFVLKGLAKFIESYYKLNLQLTFIKKLRFTNINLLSDFKYSSFVKSDSGRIQNTFSGEVEKVIQAYRAYFTSFQYGVLVAVYIVMAFIVNPQFALLVAIGGSLTNFIFKRFYDYTKEGSRKITKQLHIFQSLLIQTVSNFKYLKATGSIHSFSQKLRDSIDTTQASHRKIGLLATWLTSIREPIVMLVIVSVILLQVNVLDEPIAPIILSLLFFYRSLSFLMTLQNFWNNFLSVAGSLENMEEFIKELSDNQVQYGSVQFKEFKDKIKIKSLSFEYALDRVILDNLTFDIHKNETIAFVGESGSGKTTLMNILTGLLQVEKGMLYIDEEDITDLDILVFQKRIGYITQEPAIFNDTVFNNVTFWAEPTPENKKKFEEAIRGASIYDFVMQLDGQENSHLGDNGVMVSGGQKQRISIARELYKDVDFLFMDEATSSLDSQTEREIQENIDALKGKYTIFIIAHRLSTVKNSDRVIFLNHGKVEAIGNFQQLKESSPNFRRLTQLQEF